MRYLIALLALVGCASPARLLREEAQEQNRLAFEGRVTATVRLCKPHATECQDHHGLWDPQRNEIHLAWQWEFEPDIYLRGALAHEMLHAYLTALHYQYVGGTTHDWKFQAERERVAKALDLPTWAIPNGRKCDKLDCSLEMAALEANLARMRWSMGLQAAGGEWPSTIYDLDEE
jgi:hypothetical protein